VQRNFTGGLAGRWGVRLVSIYKHAMLKLQTFMTTAIEDTSLAGCLSLHNVEAGSGRMLGLRAPVTVRLWEGY